MPASREVRANIGTWRNKPMRFPAGVVQTMPATFRKDFQLEVDGRKSTLSVGTLMCTGISVDVSFPRDFATWPEFLEEICKAHKEVHQGYDLWIRGEEHAEIAKLV
jgi:hypothetical protein